jgi:Leucine-rich repeat (LRR) protein
MPRILTSKCSLSLGISHLRLAYNSIRSILPIVNLTSLSHLQVLDLCDNGLEILPQELGRLSKLKELYLSNNKLRKLPDAIQKMTCLEVLDLRNNDFYLLSKSTLVPGGPSKLRLS